VSRSVRPLRRRQPLGCREYARGGEFDRRWEPVGRPEGVGRGRCDGPRGGAARLELFAQGRELALYRPDGSLGVELLVVW
jgi:hypothetical protein